MLLSTKMKKHPARAKYRAIALASKSNLFLLVRFADKTNKINPRENRWLRDPKIAKLTKISKIKIL